MLATGMSDGSIEIWTSERSEGTSEVTHASDDSDEDERSLSTSPISRHPGLYRPRTVSGGQTVVDVVEQTQAGGVIDADDSYTRSP